MRERIWLQLSPPQAPGYFLAEGGPRRQAFSGDSLGQAQEESQLGVREAGTGSGLLGTHSESESNSRKKL